MRVLLAVVVVDAVVVAVGMTIPILRASGWLKVAQLLPVLIHLWLMELRKKWIVDDELQVV